MKCPHCPLGREAERPCPGERNPRVCSNADPAAPNHVPGIIARIRAFTGAAPPPAVAMLSDEERARLRAAENCPHRDCVGCGCRGCRCLPEGRRPGRVVTIKDCLACVDEAAITSPSAP